MLNVTTAATVGRAAVGAVILHDGRILLGRRAPHRRAFANRWDVIGGHVEAGERLVDALVRELREEICILPRSPRPLSALVVDDGRGGSLSLHLFIVDAWTGSIAIANDEHSELRWFAPGEAAGLATLALDDYRDIFRRIGAPVD